MREIVLDTETTGLDPREGHRIVEIACIELIHHVPTGRRFHRYVNPERDIPADALAVHGLTAEFLAQQPLFPAILDELLAFIASDPLVIHNAEFDLEFLNAELARAVPSPRTSKAKPKSQDERGRLLKNLVKEEYPDFPVGYSGG